ncbi:hypothetical protein [Ectopseudomonas oleovorans]|uniref:Uncharacterized protein n=1 Tax=Ectopseudomonas oleovorans TaxID=301 RepID=A0AA42QIZ9_ECTOL|nr:hypothetical protein [Pseudomonas oleovorans]MDH1341888.1 hypothetical protein [Pseudomonas oleovorans]MDH1490884.1 hypothetical protein [Pseudomonas oleovorans]WGG19613.1 hypothetical protein N5O83_14140 [Pseudomonas oleovorans]
MADFLNLAATGQGAKPVLPAEVLPIKPAPAAAHFDRVGWLEGRKHALDIVRDGRLLLELQGGRSQLADRLRQCMQSKPASFAKGVESIIALVQEVAQ